MTIYVNEFYENRVQISFICGNQYVVVGSYFQHYDDLLAGLMEHVGGEFKSPPILLSAALLSEYYWNWLKENNCFNLIVGE